MYVIKNIFYMDWFRILCVLMELLLPYLFLSPTIPVLKGKSAQYKAHETCQLECSGSAPQIMSRHVDYYQAYDLCV